MKVLKALGLILGVYFLAACNQEVEDKVKTVYEQIPSGGRSDKTFLVTDKYGPLQVRVGEYLGEAATTPWSSWWYPLNDKTLFKNPNGGPSTLEKYDYYASVRFNEDTRAAQFEEQELYRPGEVNWAGLCHAWAIAAVLHPEPAVERSFGGVKWTVADQKALLLKSYERATGIAEIMYGGRYTGSRDDDYDDIYPDQFHKLAQNHLMENKRPFLMDYDARQPVWTVPVYKVRFFIEKRDEESALVSAWVTFASAQVKDLNFVGTKRVVKNYKYILKGKWSNGALNVKSGEWIEESSADHPDYLISFPDSIKRGSNNTEIKTSIVDSIVN